MTETDRFDRSSRWIDLECVERERTPKPIIEKGIWLHLADISLTNTKKELERYGVSRSRTAIHNWVQKVGLDPVSDATPATITLDETIIQVNDEPHWLYAAVDPATNHLLHVRLFPTRTTQLTIGFLRELAAKHDLDSVTFLVDAARSLTSALARLGYRYRVEIHGDRTHVERVFREVERRTSSFANTFSHARPETAETWLPAFAVWWNQCQS